MAQLPRSQIQDALGFKDRKSFCTRYPLPALEAGFISMTIPDKPNSPSQEYRLTELGVSVVLS